MIDLGEIIDGDTVRITWSKSGEVIAMVDMTYDELRGTVDVSKEV